MKKFISFVMAGAMVASLVPATAFAKGEVTATAKVVDALELTASEAKSKPEINSTNYDVPQVQLKVTGVDYRTSSDAPTMDVELSLENADFLSTSDAALIALVKAKGERGDFLAVTGSAWEAKDTGSVMSNDGGDTRKALPDAEAAVNAYDDATVKLAEKYGKTITVVGATAADVTLTKSGEADIVVVDQDVDDDAFAAGIDSDKIVDALKNGYELTDASKVLKIENLDGDTISVVSAKVPAITVDEVIARDFAGYVRGDMTGGTAKVSVAVKEKDDDRVTYTFTGFFEKDDVIAFDLASKLTKISEGTKATVSVDSKMATADDLTYASVLGNGIKASVKKTVDIAEEEVTTLYSGGLKIESSVGDFVTNQEFDLKLSNGFEFSKVKDGAKYDFGAIDDNEVTVKFIGTPDDEFTINGDDIEIEATSAKSGAVATLTVKAKKDSTKTGTFSSTATVEVAKVVDYKVSLTVDADDDIPVIYSGTNVANKGLTDDSDHMSLEVTAEETFPGAWSMRQGFNFNLPDGVYVTDVDVVSAENFYQEGSPVSDQKNAWEKAFFDAYQEGDHKNFEFKKRVFDDVNTNLASDPAKVSFKLELVADPTFEGDVTLGFEGALVDKQEVKIAKFVKPYTVKAEQNDVIIDYRNTEVKTPIVITEAEAGLWEKNNTDLFKLNIEDDLLTFEDDATFTVDADSDMELKNEDTSKGTVVFTVKSESDKAASVTISDLKLYMSRSIPAGAYDLEINTVMSDAYKQEILFAPDADTFANYNAGTTNVDKTAWSYNSSKGEYTRPSGVKEDSYVDDVCDYSKVVKAAFINVVTSGRDNDNLFTTKVVVPVGEAYLLAGEAKVELDAPAYISAAGYTMLPVRAISKALGVNTNNVLWNAETRTVTVMYAQRIITMTVGQKTIYVNGSAIPSSAAPEIKDGRTFLPLRDLGTALGVTNVNWDAATKTATLN